MHDAESDPAAEPQTRAQVQHGGPSPHEPAFATADLPGIGGRIGPDPADFRVDEVPAYVPTGEGEHLYVRVEKQSMTTPELVQQLARASGVEPRDIGYAGLKDKHAITSQWLSLPGRARPVAEWQLPETVRVLETSRHNNKLRTGHLNGNRFRIRLVDVQGTAEATETLKQALLERGLPNYFGAQRFGRGGENLGRALGWLRGGGKARLSSFLLKLYPSVAQSELFNRYLSRRRELGLAQLFVGEVVRLEGSSATFVVEDAERELARLHKREIHLTGPLPGPKMRAANGQPLELERRVATEIELTEVAEATLGKFAPGARRDLVVFPEHFEISAPSSDQLELSFVLPAGSYATVLVREFTRAPLTQAENSARES